MRNSPSSEDSETVPEMPPDAQTDWAYLEAMTGEEAYQNALADPDNPPLTDEQLARMRRVPNPQQIRKQLGLTQRQFSRQFEIALGTLRDWEQGTRRPDSAARAYLRVIEQMPDAVRSTLDARDGEAAPGNEQVISSVWKVFNRPGTMTSGSWHWCRERDSNPHGVTPAAF